MGKVLQFAANHWILVAAFVGALVALFVIEALSKGLSGINRLTPFQATRLINSENAVVIDIRDMNAYDKGHITNAVHILPTELDKNIKRLEQYKHQPLIIVCAIGQKSRYFIEKLRKQGYEKVYILMGGMSAWNNADMPVVK